MKQHLGRILGAAAVLALVVSACDQSAITDADQEITEGVAENGAVIPGRYIVVLKPDAVAGKTVRQVVDEVVSQVGADPDYRYDAALAGFAAPLGGGQLASLRSDPRVAYIEPDRHIQLPPFTIEGVCDVNPNHPKCDPGGGGGGSEPPPPPPEETPWGVARVNGGADGVGKRVCVLDTGVDLDHPDLEVDAAAGYNAVNSGRDAKLGLDDGNGHGTHVSGTIGAKINGQGVVGVAAGATIVPVKVLSHSGSGSYAGVIAGVNYVASGDANCSVANMSLGGPVSSALDQAVKNAAATGVGFTLAAGNESDDADNHSPARTEGANVYTVSAFGQGDVWASFSNYGSHVDWAEPGVGVLSTYKDGGYATGSGTSMAAPHLAGILALGAVKDGGTVSGDPDGNADTIGVH